MDNGIRCVSPVDGSIYVERPFATPSQIDAALKQATKAQAGWRRMPLAERAAMLTKAVDAFTARSDEIADSIT